MIDPFYAAAAVQIEVKAHYVTQRDYKAQLWSNIDRHLAAIDRTVLECEHRNMGLPPRLLVFPECSLHGLGALRTRTLSQLRSMALRIPGEETEALAAKCRQHFTYLAGSAFEIDDEFPGCVFQTGFIIDSAGEVILKYRKLNTTINAVEVTTSPYDVLDRYGNDPKKIFPVVDTPIGRLGMLICLDIGIPEMARCLALNDAEILIHPTSSWGASNMVTGLDMLLRNRATENGCYVISSNWAYSPESEYPMSVGRSRIVNPSGAVVEQLLDAREASCFGGIELAAARQKGRVRSAGKLPLKCFAAAYAAHEGWPSNLAGESQPETLDDKWALLRKPRQSPRG